LLELSGLTSSGDLARDVDNIRRYLVRLVPQLEMELENAKTDNYLDAKGRIANGMASGKADDAQTTAQAVAAHMLDKGNPHGVTLAQLGFSFDRAAQVNFTDTGMVFRIGGEHGLQINTQRVSVPVNQWTVTGGIAWAEVNLDAWEQRAGVISFVQAQVLHAQSNSGQRMDDVWCGVIRSYTRDECGTLRLFKYAETQDATEQVDRTVTIGLMAVGVYGYGD